MTYTQKYFAMLTGNKRIKKISDCSEEGVGLIACILLDLIDENVVTINDQGKLVTEVNRLSDELEYLSRIFYFIQEKEPVSPQNIIDYFLSGFTTKINELFQAVGTSLARLDQFKEIETDGILRSKKFYEVSPDYFNAIKQNISIKSIENVSNEDLMMLTILEKSNLLKKYVSKKTRKNVRILIKKYKNEPMYRLIEKLFNRYDAIIVVVTVAPTVVV